MTTGSAMETTRYLKFLAEEMIKVNLKIGALSDWLRCKHPHDKDLITLLHQFPRSAVFVPQLLTDTGIWNGDSGRPAPVSNRRDKLPREHEADSEAGDINENCDGWNDKGSLYDQESSSQSNSEQDRGSDTESDSSTSSSDSNKENDMKQRLADLRFAKGPQLARRSIPFPKKPKDVQKKNRTSPSPDYQNKSKGNGTDFNDGIEDGENENTSDENVYEGNDLASLSSSMSSSGSLYSWSSASNLDNKKDIRLTVPDVENDVKVVDLNLAKVKDENSGELEENHVGTEKETEETDPKTGPITRQREAESKCGLGIPSNRIRTAGLEAELRPCNVKLTRMTQEFINRHNQSGTSGVKRKWKKNILNRKCGYCSKEFRSHTDLVRHELIHTGQKPFPCKLCGKSFRRKWDLVRHHRIHTGEKPFACKLCGKHFLHKHVLEVHLRIHTGKKPFSCKVCGKFFRHKWTLVMHNRIHTREKPFPCKGVENVTV